MQNDEDENPGNTLTPDSQVLKQISLRKLWLNSARSVFREKILFFKLCNSILCMVFGISSRKKEQTNLFTKTQFIYLK